MCRGLVHHSLLDITTLMLFWGFRTPQAGVNNGRYFIQAFHQQDHYTLQEGRRMRGGYPIPFDPTNQTPP
jgi:hypothetical protein